MRTNVRYHVHSAQRCTADYFAGNPWIVSEKIGFLSEQFVKTGSKVVFRVCLSSSLLINVYSIGDFSSIPWNVVFYCVAVICILFLLGLVSAVLTTKNPARRGVILHAVFRSIFAIIGLSLAASLGDDQAVSVASVVSAFTIPLYNVSA